MRLDRETCRERLSAARVAHLGTVGADRRPHLVPVTFALIGDRIVTAVDRKPKSTPDLRRIRNIADNPQVAVLCDHYEDDWTRLWWVRADGHARIVRADGQRQEYLDALATKYDQYRRQPPDGPVVVVTVHGWTGWTHAAA
ncbi:MAG TPA: TIGR03668 family PPOX class F420-dependent oxidoreductase [Jiangellaceae bacterium]|nr:TIGR03668 family PPOX class F420-dependent oxidoreductase [Jiangellaceae bacterium]